MPKDDFDDDDSVEVESGDDLRTELSAAWDQHADVDPTDSTEVQESAEQSEVSDSRQRDDKGRFLPKEAQATSGEEETLEKGVEAVAPEGTPQIADTRPPVLPPATWAAEKKQQWANVPRELQEEIQRVDIDTRRYLQRVTEEAAQVKRTWAEVEQALTPRMQQFAQAGVSPGRVVAQFMAWQDKLDSNPKQGLRELAQSYGLDIRQLAEEEAQVPQVPPYVRELQQQVQQMHGLLQSRQQAEQTAKVQGIHNELGMFANEKDAQGNLLRPYLERVVDEMIPIVQVLRTQAPQASNRELLQRAYEKALWMNDETREYQVRKQTAASQTPERIERAKRAQKLVNGHARAGFSKQQPDSLRGDLLAAWEEAEGQI